MTTLLALSTLIPAHALDIEAIGECPGPVDIVISDVTAGGSAYVAAGSVAGTKIIPGGPCAGVDVGIAVDSVFGPFVDSDNDTVITKSPTPGDSKCDLVFKAVDTATCEVSAAAGFRSQLGCAAGETNAWIQGDFEAGLFASTTVSGNGEVVNTVDANTGMYSAELSNGGAYVQQFFNPPVPVSALASAGWTWWADTGDGAISYVGWTYSDGSGSNNVFLTTDFGDWVGVDLLPYLDATKSLASLQIYGYSGGGPAPDIVRLDDMHLCY